MAAPTELWYLSVCVDFVAFLNHHHAPATSYPTERSGYLTAALCSVLLLGAVSACIYFFKTSSPGKPLVWQLSLMGTTWLAAALGGYHFLRQLPVGELVFDGVDWYFSEALDQEKADDEKVDNERVDNERVGSVSVRFDGQHCLLLRFEDDLNKAAWLWLEARSTAHQDPNSWLDLRRAVYSRASPQNLSNVI